MSCVTVAADVWRCVPKMQLLKETEKWVSLKVVTGIVSNFPMAASLLAR